MGQERQSIGWYGTRSGRIHVWFGALAALNRRGVLYCVLQRGLLNLDRAVTIYEHGADDAIIKPKNCEVGERAGRLRFVARAPQHGWPHVRNAHPDQTYQDIYILRVLSQVSYGAVN